MYVMGTSFDIGGMIYKQRRDSSVAVGGRRSCNQGSQVRLSEWVMLRNNLRPVVRFMRLLSRRTVWNRVQKQVQS